MAMAPARRSLAATLAAALYLLGCAGAPAPRTPTAGGDMDAVAAVRAEFQAAENAGDIARVRATFAEDIVMLAPNAPAAIGRDSATARLQATFNAGRLQIAYESQETVVTGDWAFDRGTYRFTMTPRGGSEPSRQVGKYLWIYRRDAAGQWKLSRIAWNSSERPAPPR